MNARTTQDVFRKPVELDQTRTPQTRPSSTTRLVRTAELRDRVNDLHEQVNDLHEDTQAMELDLRASQLAQTEAGELLATLRQTYGLSWETLAHMLRVSSAAIRKWRRGDQISAENRHRLAKVLAFCELLSRVDPRITDPAQWLEEPFVSSVTLRAADLYAADLLSPLLSVAASRMERNALLDQFDHDWRENYKADAGWTVQNGPDDQPLIVRRRS